MTVFANLGKWLYIFRACVRNLNLWVQVHPGELWVSKSAGALSTRSLKISGCKRPKDLWVCAPAHPAAPVLTQSLYPIGLISVRIKILHGGNFFTK